MSFYTENIKFDVVLPHQNLLGKKQIFMTLAQEAADNLSVSEKAIYERLIEKEKFSNSVIGDGVAIPNIRIKGLVEPFTILTTLKKPIDFDTVDDIAVDLVCFVASPESDGPIHLRRLSRISRLLKNQSMHKKICEAKDADVIKALLVNPEGWLMAA